MIAADCDWAYRYACHLLSFFYFLTTLYRWCYHIFNCDATASPLHSFKRNLNPPPRLQHVSVSAISRPPSHWRLHLLRVDPLPCPPFHWRTSSPWWLHRYSLTARKSHWGSSLLTSSILKHFTNMSGCGQGGKVWLTSCVWTGFGLTTGTGTRKGWCWVSPQDLVWQHPCRGGVKCISGLIYEETRGVHEIFLENVHFFHSSLLFYMTHCSFKLFVTQ